MAKSLADQLMNAGLVDKNKAKQAQRQQRKAAKQQQKGQLEADDTAERLRKEREAKAERDRALNRQRQAVEQARAIKAQVEQMLQQHRIAHGGEVRYSFTDKRLNKIKPLYVSPTVQDQLARGLVAICVDQQDRYCVVPKTIADKIVERFPESLVFLAEKNTEVVNNDDPYADYPIPDDLMW
ncbi:MAG: DUF2058 domain-containing protein [Saccharospirillum sp.]